MILVIVESPSKCKKIEEYLGEDYKVIASFGHIREIKKLENIDIENNFKTKYEIIEEKNKNLLNIEKEIKKSNEVILATDNDNEGEAIAWHICDALNLSINNTKRIVFNEITKSALEKAITNPLKINMNIVNSQQTRQILDLLIGFKISPMLWKHISAKSKLPLSAGRCQTPTLRLIYDNYIEIKENIGSVYFKTTGFFTKQCIPFELVTEFEKKEDVEFFLEKSVNHQHNLQISQPEVLIKPPPKPFITSSVQQFISNELNYSPKETMKICQQLYEKGHITYMRTETKKYSKEFIKQVCEYLKNKLGLKPSSEEKLNEIDISFCHQTNHEAIRPTNINMNEYTLKEGKVSEDFKKLSLQENKLMKVYNIIWRNSIQSCMEDAKYNSITAKIQGYENNIFKYNTQKIIYEGWKRFDKKDDKTNKNYDYLLSILGREISKKVPINYIKIISEENIKNIKLHYSEAGLIKKIEEIGIGRPSTFSMLVDKIQERKYVSKENIKGEEKDCILFVLENNELEEKKTKKIFGNEKNKLKITCLGIMVIEFLINYYDKIFDYNYTKQMEFFLDEIEKGNKNKVDICRLCNFELTECTDKLNGLKKTGIIEIDNKHTFMIGKNGPVIKKTEDNGKIVFMSVREGIDIKKIQNCNVEEIIDKKNSIKLGIYKNEELILKKSKYGLYVVYGNNKKSIVNFTNRPLENITYEEVIDILKKDDNDNKDDTDNNDDKNDDKNETKEKVFLRKVSDNISIRNGKYGNYIFFKTTNMKTPKFFKLNGFDKNVIDCNIDILKNWIKEKYKIY